MGIIRKTASITTLSSVIVAASVSLLTAPAANADNASYLAAMQSIGLYPQYTADSLLHVGKDACGALAPSEGLMFGRSPNLVARMVWQASPQFERNQAALLVNAAIDNLCPGVNMLGYAAV
jgi:hypothetical protein